MYEKPSGDKNRLPKNAPTKPPRGILLPLLEVSLTMGGANLLINFPRKGSANGGGS